MSKERLRQNSIRRAACLLLALLVILAWGPGQVGFVHADTGTCPSGRDGEHDWKVTITTRATETKDGERTFTCRSCGETYTEAIPATGHVWGDWEVTREPNCTEKGEKTRTCTKHEGLNHTEKEAIPAKGHDLTKTAAKAATETKEGNIAYYTCSVCGKLFSDSKGKKEITKADTVIPAKGKKPAKEETKKKDSSGKSSGSGSSGSSGSGSSVVPQLPANPVVGPGLNTKPFAPALDNKEENKKKESVNKSEKKDKDSEPESTSEVYADSGMPDAVDIGNEPVPLGAADVAIAGANGIALIYFVILLLPLFRVWFWIMKKRREAEEDQ